MLHEETILGSVDKVQIAIERIKAFEPPEGYFLAFSGGKDSQCIYYLAKMANVKFDAHYSVTTVDPPELLQFIKDYYPDVQWDWPIGKDGKRTSMYKLISENTSPPTRQSRYCCRAFKEMSGKGRVTLTGVRWDESVRRRYLHGIVNITTKSVKLKNTQLANNEAAMLNDRGSLIFMDDNDETKRVVETCYSQLRVICNPIIDWTDEDVWEFLNSIVQAPHCCLYDEGLYRLGCVGCPMQGREGMIEDFKRWPKFKTMYLNAFKKMIDNHSGELRIMNTSEKIDYTETSIMDWWLWMHRSETCQNEPNPMLCKNN